MSKFGWDKSVWICPILIVLLKTEPILSLNSPSLIFMEPWTNVIFILVLHVQLGRTDINPLSSTINSSLSTSSHTPGEANEVEGMLFRVSEAVSNSDVSYSNQSRGISKPGNRTGKLRRFRKKQFLKNTRKPRPYFFKTERITGDSMRPNSKLKRPDLNFDEELQINSLRRNILKRLGDVDPKSCLPKALCAISSRNNQFTNNNMNDDAHDVEKYLKIVKAVTIDPKKDQYLSSTQDKRQSNKNGARGSESSEESSESSSSSELSQDDMEFLKEKARIEKWMQEEDYDSEPNWWDVFPSQPYYSFDEPVPLKSSESSWSTFSPFRISKGLSSLFGSFLPAVSWGLGKAPDVFADDPFFKEFRSLGGRSLTNGDKRSFSWLFGKSDKLGHPTTPNEYVKGKNKSWHNKRANFGKKNKNNERKLRKGKRIKSKSKNRDKKTRRNLNDYDKDMNMIDDPVEKFQLAVEIGKQIDDPKQCDYVFTGCEFSYQEVIEIIESSKKSVEDENNFNMDYSFNKKSDINMSDKILTQDMPAGDHLEISLKIIDPIQGTAIPHTTVLKKLRLPKPIEHVTHEPSKMPDATSLPKEDQSFQIQPDQQVDGSPTIPEMHNTNISTANSPFRSSLYEKDQLNNDPVGESFLPPTRSRPHTNKRKSAKPQKKKVKSSGTRVRKPWGLQSEKTKLGPPTIFRQTQLHTHTKYRPLSVPSTVNKPSHVVNYHFHNTNTHPQISHNNMHPQSLPAYSLTQKENTTSSPPISSTLNPSRTNDRAKKKGARRSKIRHRKQRPNSDERIVIRLPESNPSNNYYNLYPSMPLLNSFYPSPQHSSPSQSYFSSMGYLPSHAPPSPLSFYGSSPIMSPPSPPSGMLPYFLGKK